MATVQSQNNREAAAPEQPQPQALSSGSPMNPDNRRLVEAEAIVRGARPPNPPVASADSAHPVVLHIKPDAAPAAAKSSSSAVGTTTPAKLAKPAAPRTEDQPKVVPAPVPAVVEETKVVRPEGVPTSRGEYNTFNHKLRAVMYSGSGGRWGSC